MPAMLEWATALCRQDEAAFSAFVGASPAPYSGIGKRFSPPQSDWNQVTDTADPLVASICASLGVTPDVRALSIGDARDRR